MTHSPSRHWCRAALGAAVLAALGAGCHRRTDAPTGPAAVRPADDPAPVRVTTAVAQARELPQTLAVTGTLMPDQQSQVTPLVAGRVTEVLVERGAVVRAGQVMLRLRDVDYRSSAAAASAQLAQVRARLGINGRERFDPAQTPEVRAAAAQLELADDARRRAEQLHAAGTISDQELQRARTAAAAAREQHSAALNNVRSAYFQLRSARVAADQASRSVADSVVRAPFDGEVAERMANVGEFVAPQRPVVLLVRTDPLRLELQLPQERIAHVRRGQNVEVRVDAFPDRVFRGTVQYISPAVRTDTRALTVDAVVPNPDGALRPGLFATARLVLEQRQRVVAVPPAAVQSEAGTHRAYVIVDGRAQERIVAIAERTPDAILLARGVAAGERVATDRLDRLADGARVQE